MKYYAVVQLWLHADGWVAEYVKHVTPLVAKQGGRYLSRTARLERVEGEGELPNVMVLLEFPSREAALAMYNDPAYEPYLNARLAGAKGDFLILAGEDMTGAASV